MTLTWSQSLVKSCPFITNSTSTQVHFENCISSCCWPDPAWSYAFGSCSFSCCTCCSHIAGTFLLTWKCVYSRFNLIQPLVQVCRVYAKSSLNENQKMLHTSLSVQPKSVGSRVQCPPHPTAVLLTSLDHATNRKTWLTLNRRRPTCNECCRKGNFRWSWTDKLKCDRLHFTLSLTQKTQKNECTSKKQAKLSNFNSLSQIYPHVLVSLLTAFSEGSSFRFEWDSSSISASPTKYSASDIQIHNAMSDYICPSDWILSVLNDFPWCWNWPAISDIATQWKRRRLCQSVSFASTNQRSEIRPWLLSTRWIQMRISHTKPDSGGRSHNLRPYTQYLHVQNWWRHTYMTLMHVNTKMALLWRIMENDYWMIFWVSVSYSRYYIKYLIYALVIVN